MTVCSQHSECTKTVMVHGERLATLENRVDKLEEVQEGMVYKLEEAAEGLRALAGKIDGAVSAARQNGQVNGNNNTDDPAPESFTKSLNCAWKHFQKNFAMFLVYGGAAFFIWAVFGKMFFFKEVPPWLKSLLGGG